MNKVRPLRKPKGQIPANAKSANDDPQFEHKDQGHLRKWKRGKEMSCLVTEKAKSRWLGGCTARKRRVQTAISSRQFTRCEGKKEGTSNAPKPYAGRLVGESWNMVDLGQN